MPTPPVTEIRVRYTVGASAYLENGWTAELVENGEVVWPECRSFSAISADHAKQRLLNKLSGNADALGDLE